MSVTVAEFVQRSGGTHWMRNQFVARREAVEQQALAVRRSVATFLKEYMVELEERDVIAHYGISLEERKIIGLYPLTYRELLWFYVYATQLVFGPTTVEFATQWARLVGQYQELNAEVWEAEWQAFREDIRSRLEGIR